MKVFSLIQQAVTRYRKAVAKVSGLGAHGGERTGEGAGINMALPGDGGGRPGGGERESAAARAASPAPPARTCGRKVLGALWLDRGRHPHGPWTLSGSSGLRSGRPGVQSRHRARQSAARGRRGGAWRGAPALPSAGPGNPAPGLSPSRPAAEGWPWNFGGVERVGRSGTRGSRSRTMDLLYSCGISGPRRQPWLDRPGSWAPLGAMEWLRCSLPKTPLPGFAPGVGVPSGSLPLLSWVCSGGCGAGAAQGLRSEERRFLSFLAGVVTSCPLKAFLHNGAEVEGRFVRPFYPLCLTTAYVEVAL